MGSWLLETSLDVEWAHAIAPAADVLLVEAENDTFPNLLGAVDVAVTNGARTVSMSWGGPEFMNETHDDRHFNKAGVTFTTSSGDRGTGVQYPAASPYVVAIGGTTLPLDRKGVLTAPETAWSGSGGGISAYESAPDYQGSYAIPATEGKRGVPDVAYDADPNTGIAVYGSTLNQGQPGWFEVGGTSVGAPQWAALVALANQGRANGTLSSSDTDRSPFYSAAVGVSYASNYRDITVGSNGSCGNLCSAGLGYDFVAGLGSPQADALVPFLNTH